ncbi:MAG: SCP2 sterol-binding domain-containing protein [Pseudomonadota bacterium]|nr:SCP2 sterol-binding domain-containing protein [Pseudomonadota bacterium]
MSETLEEARISLQEKIQGAQIDGSIKFEVEDLGSIVISEGKVTISEIDTDCTLKGNLETFQQIFNGELNATSAFMSGRLTVDGSMGVAMQYNSVLS